MMTMIEVADTIREIEVGIYDRLHTAEGYEIGYEVEIESSQESDDAAFYVKLMYPFKVIAEFGGYTIDIEGMREAAKDIDRFAVDYFTDRHI